MLTTQLKDLQEENTKAMAELQELSSREKREKEKALEQEKVISELQQNCDETSRKFTALQQNCDETSRKFTALLFYCLFGAGELTGLFVIYGDNGIHQIHKLVKGAHSVRAGG